MMLMSPSYIVSFHSGTPGELVRNVLLFFCPGSWGALVIIKGAVEQANNFGVFREPCQKAKNKIK